MRYSVANRVEAVTYKETKGCCMLDKINEAMKETEQQSQQHEEINNTGRGTKGLFVTILIKSKEN